MITNRTADEIRQGKVMSSQCMFHTALQTERDLGLNLGRTMSSSRRHWLALVNPEMVVKHLNEALVLSATLNRSINASKCHIGRI